MNKKIRIMKQYNSSDVVAVISPYPKKGEVYSSGTTGVASYSKNVVREFSRNVLVLTDYEYKKDVYEEGNTLVKRCYQKNSSMMWLDIYRTLQQFKEIKKVMIHFDFSMYGGFITSGFILPFVLFLKLKGYSVSVVSHHVVLDVNKLSGHLGLTGNLLDRMKAAIYNGVFRQFYFLLGLSTDTIIVLEEVLKKRLSNVIREDKIKSIPHAVDTTLTSVSQMEARKKLGIKSDEQVVLFFGFVNWFKGADFFVKTFGNVTKLLNKPARFILAGGKSATMSDKGFYQKYFTQVTGLIQKSKKVELTGYVSQEDIKLYFAAADLVVFPYRDFMCASGVMSLTFSYKKPFLVSSELAPIFDTPAMQQSIKEAGLITSDMIFDLKETALLNQTTNVLANGLKKKLVTLSQSISQQRSFAKTAILYEDALFAKTTADSGSLALEVSQAYGK